MLSQFSKEIPEHFTLADLTYDFPKDVYPVGRLDKDSEGLLILTNDKAMTDKLLNPISKHERTYLVQVEGIPDEIDLMILRDGVEIKLKKGLYKCLPLKAEVINNPDFLPQRIPPIRYRESIPTTWLKITLVEGKNRQIRKMTAKIGFPTLRLVRYNIEKLILPDTKSGDIIIYDKNEIYRLLKINKL